MNRRIPLTATLFVFLPGCLGLPLMSGNGFVDSQCQDLGTSAEAQRVSAFLEAGQQFEADTLALSAEVEGTCQAIADDLGIEVPSAGSGELQVQATCQAVAQEIGVIVDEALPTGASLELYYSPPVCSFEVNAMAECVAECDASFTAEGTVTCEGGEIVGTCEGTCSGECRTSAGTEQVDGYCAGECAGSCDVEMQAPRCEGEAYVEADASCQAVCEAELTARAECTEPELELYASVDIDPEAQARFDLLVASLYDNYPRLLSLEEKLQRVAESGGAMIEAFEGAADAAGDLGMQASACFATSTMMAAESMANVNVTLSVTVEVSASVTAQAG